MTNEKPRKTQTEMGSFFVRADFRTLAGSVLLLIVWPLLYIFIIKTADLSTTMKDPKNLIAFVALSVLVTLFVLWNFLKTERNTAFFDVDHIVIRRFPGGTTDVRIEELTKCRLGFHERGHSQKNRTNIALCWPGHSMILGLHENGNVDKVVQLCDECGIPFECTWGGKPAPNIEEMINNGTPILEVLYKQDQAGARGIHL